MKAFLAKMAKLVLGFIPTRLPVGMTEFERWSDDLIATYKLPTSDKDSLKFTLASIIMHLGPQAAYKSKFYFYLTLNAGAAKQVAGAVFYEIKEKQRKAAEEAAKKAQDEQANGQKQ